MLDGRDDATCRKLIDKVGVKDKTFDTDDWECYHRVIPGAQLFTGKDLTFPPGWNSVSLVCSDQTVRQALDKGAWGFPSKHGRSTSMRIPVRVSAVMLLTAQALMPAWAAGAPGGAPGGPGGVAPGGSLGGVTLGTPGGTPGAIGTPGLPGSATGNATGPGDIGSAPGRSGLATGVPGNPDPASGVATPGIAALSGEASNGKGPGTTVVPGGGVGAGASAPGSSMTVFGTSASPGMGGEASPGGPASSQ